MQDETVDEDFNGEIVKLIVDCKTIYDRNICLNNDNDPPKSFLLRQQ